MCVNSPVCLAVLRIVEQRKDWKTVGKNNNYWFSTICHGQGGTVRWINTTIATWFFLSSHRISDSATPTAGEILRTRLMLALISIPFLRRGEKRSNGFLATYKIETADGTSGFFSLAGHSVWRRSNQSVRNSIASEMLLFLLFSLSVRQRSKFLQRKKLKSRQRCQECSFEETPEHVLLLIDSDCRRWLYNF